MRPIVKGNYFQTETLPERVLAVLSHRPVLDDKRTMPNLGRNAMVKSPSLRCSKLQRLIPAMVIPIRGDFFAVSRLSWRPLLSVPYHRIPCTAQDRFCGRAALAALPRDSQCHCMPDIYAQSV
jgi:hypothetical protein